METKTSTLSRLVAWPPQVTHWGVSVTRLAYAATIFIDMAQVYRWRGTSFVPATAWVGQFMVPAAMVALLLFGIGFASRISAILAFVLVRVVYEHLPETYALDHITELVTLVFVFAPTPRALAVDVRLRKIKPAPLEVVPAWFSLALFLCIELVYGNSVLNKMRSIVWRDGLTFWLTMTLPHFSADRLPDVFKISWVLRIATYVALALETLFPLVLVKPLRRWVIVVGVVLHLSIAIFLPIPLFGIGFTVLFLAFVDWRPLGRRLGWNDSPVVVPESATNRFGKLGYALSAFMIAAEALVTVPAKYVPPLALVQPYLAELGFSNFGVYLDFHFTIPKPIERVVATSGGRTINLPSYDESGHPQTTGRYWCMFAIGELRWQNGDDEGSETMNRYLTGALTREGISEAEISIYGRDVSIPLRMTPNLEHEISERPWKLIATGTYQSGHSRLKWNIEGLQTAGRLP